MTQRSLFRFQNGFGVQGSVRIQNTPQRLTFRVLLFGIQNRKIALFRMSYAL